jgi:hypothetical protein
MCPGGRLTARGDQAPVQVALRRLVGVALHGATELLGAQHESVATVEPPCPISAPWHVGLVTEHGMGEPGDIRSAVSHPHKCPGAPMSDRIPSAVNTSPSPAALKSLGRPATCIAWISLEILARAGASLVVARRMVIMGADER